MPAAKPLRDALDRYREAIDFVCGYVRDRGYPTRFALAPRPSGGTIMPTIGHALAFIATVDRPEMVGLSPEVVPGTMAGPSTYHELAQALWSGKVFHIDLDARQIGLHGQDPRIRSGGSKTSSFW